MEEQKINVKSTYVATVKKDVAGNALNFYANEKKGEDLANNIFPDTPISEAAGPAVSAPIEPTPEVVVPEIPSPEVTIPEPVIESKPEETIVLPQELKVENSAPVEVPVSAPAPAEVVNPEPVAQPEPLPGIPNLNVLEPEIPASVTPEPIAPEPVSTPVVEQTVNPIPMPSAPPTPEPAPIPNPVPEPVNPTPVNDTFASIDNMVNQVSQQVNENPIRFDASHETNLLGALNENANQPNMGNIPVTPENLNVVREFGVDEPIVADQNGVPVNKPAMGFINSKILLVLVIVFFLASCVFLGYEIYRYVTLPK